MNTFDTNVKKLDWDCVNDDTRSVTHGIHRYSGKFIPQIARNAIELLTDSGDLILDPYCGSGTTLLESWLLGRKAIGFDLNPLAVLIAQVKTTPIDNKALRGMYEELKTTLAPLLCVSSKQQNLFHQGMTSSDIAMDEVHGDPRWQNPWYTKWFYQDILKELIVIHRRISAIADESLRRVALVTFSDILRKSSNANSSYPNVMFDKNKASPPPATPRFINRLDEVITSLQTLPKDIHGLAPPKVEIGDATNLPLKNNSVDAVITHPPYIASIPYAEYGSLSITWLGHNPKDLDKKLTGGRRHASDVVERFSENFSKMLAESFRVLKPGKMLFLMVGSPTVRGKRIDLAAMSLELSQRSGFTIVTSHKRTGINRRANLMGEETLLFAQKPQSRIHAQLDKEALRATS